MISDLKPFPEIFPLYTFEDSVSFKLKTRINNLMVFEKLCYPPS